MSFDKVVGQVLGTASKSMTGGYTSAGNTLSDRTAMQEFKSMEEAVVADPSLNIMTPVFKNDKKKTKAKEAEALAQVFNQRKQEVISRKTSPGISQTRTM